ncbi:hypothetical protein F4677DRAFT_239087 [Hypoxylon crocopeplum]|nr:hypothetical protein F4677DRAFT_239087 [Hypoxylon crocopeplum]
MHIPPRHASTIVSIFPFLLFPFFFLFFFQARSFETNGDAITTRSSTFCRPTSTTSSNGIRHRDGEGEKRLHRRFGGNLLSSGHRKGRNHGRIGMVRDEWMMRKTTEGNKRKETNGRKGDKVQRVCLRCSCAY